MVIKYLFYYNKKIADKDLEESIIQDQEAFAKEQFLESLIDTIKATHDKYNNIISNNKRKRKNTQ